MNKLKTAIERKYSRDVKPHIIAMSNDKKMFLGGGALIGGTFIANVLNYIFNAYLGRVLNFTDFSLIGLIGSFYSFASIFMGAYSTTVNYQGSFLIGKYGDAAGYSFWKYARKQMLFPSLILTALWLVSIPFLMNFFHTTNLSLFLLFSLILLFGFISNVNQGFLYAKMLFGALAVITLTDPLIRLAVIFLLVYLGLGMWTFSAIPVAVFVVFIVGWLLIRRHVTSEKTTAPSSEVHNFSKKFFFVSLLSGISTTAYFTFDIFLAKHYLSPTLAGEYTLVSLVGKMIYFLGSLTSPFIIPIISRKEGASRNSLTALYVLLAVTGFLVFVGFILFGLFAPITVPLLYGEKARVIVPYLFLFTLGMAFYTLSNIIVKYYLARKNYLFTIVGSFLIVAQIGLLLKFHSNLQAFVTVMSCVLSVNLVVMLLLHFGVNHFKKLGKYYRNFSYVFNKTK